jgi:hypothetical protein
MFGGRPASRIFEEFQQPAIKTRTLGYIFIIKSVSANRKKGVYTSRLPKNEKIGGTFVFSDSGSEL